MKISIIAAVAENGVIGRNNKLPWRLSSDMKRFKELTMGHHLLVGRKTWESIGRPLPGRHIIVVSHGSPRLPEGVHLASSMVDGIERARSWDEEELFVAGGASIYTLTLPSCDRIYLTRVRARVDGDAFFPKTDWSAWAEISRVEVEADEHNDHPTSFIVYERPPPMAPPAA